jgi:hypothetical protein
VGYTARRLLAIGAELVVPLNAFSGAVDVRRIFNTYVPTTCFSRLQNGVYGRLLAGEQVVTCTVLFVSV